MRLLQFHLGMNLEAEVSKAPRNIRWYGDEKIKSILPVPAADSSPGTFLGQNVVITKAAIKLGYPCVSQLEQNRYLQRYCVG